MPPYGGRANLLIRDKKSPGLIVHTNLSSRLNLSLPFDSNPSLGICFRLTEDPPFQEVHFIGGQGFSEGREEGQIVRRVVEREQNPCQQFIGGQQVVHVGSLVVLAAVAATPLHQGPEVVSVPGQSAETVNHLGRRSRGWDAKWHNSQFRRR